jgi:hypothetical protein
MNPPEKRSPAIWQDGRAKLQTSGKIITKETDTAPLDFQARRARRLFFFTALSPLIWGLPR